MKKIPVITAITLILALAAAFPAYAGVFGTVRSWLTGEVAALMLSALTMALAGAFGLLFGRVARTFREAGEFLNVLGTALEDSRISREELVMIIRQGKDIFGVWR